MAPDSCNAPKQCGTSSAPPARTCCNTDQDDPRLKTRSNRFPVWPILAAPEEGVLQISTWLTSAPTSRKTTDVLHGRNHTHQLHNLFRHCHHRRCCTGCCLPLQLFSLDRPLNRIAPRLTSALMASASGRLDAIICPLNAGDPHLLTFPILQDEAVVVASADHPVFSSLLLSASQRYANTAGFCLVMQSPPDAGSTRHSGHISCLLLRCRLKQMPFHCCRG